MEARASSVDQFLGVGGLNKERFLAEPVEVSKGSTLSSMHNHAYPTCQAPGQLVQVTAGRLLLFSAYEDTT